MKQDKWTQQLHDKLAEHETAAPSDLWADIEAALPNAQPSPLTSHPSPLTSHLSPLTSHLSPLTVGPLLSLCCFSVVRWCGGASNRSSRSPSSFRQKAPRLNSKSPP